MNYSGSVKFKYEIYVNDVEVQLLIDGDANHVDAYISGPSEDCYIGEHEVNINSAIDKHNVDWADKLSDIDIENIKEKIVEIISHKSCYDDVSKYSHDEVLEYDAIYDAEMLHDLKRIEKE